MKGKLSRFSFAVVLIGMLSCGNKGNPVSPPAYTVLETSTGIVSTTNGGVISLANGSYVAIAPGTFPTDTTMTLSLLPAMNKQPPNSYFTGVGPSLMLTFGGTVTLSPARFSKKSASVPASGLQLVIAYDSNMTVLSGSEPIADFVDLSGSHNFIGPAGVYDSTTRTATYTVSLSALGEIGSINIGQANLNPVYTGGAPPRYGARVWNGKNWVAYPQGLDRTKKTLVVVHGIFSNSETAFNCVNQIMQAGGYDQVIGWDYDWTDRADPQGTLLADFLDQLSTDIPSIDIEAHSYGGLVSLDAISKSKIHINNLITEGSPLSGTPAARLAISLEEQLSPCLTSMYNLGTAAGYPWSPDKKTAADVLGRGLTKTFVEDLGDGSVVIPQILARSNPPPPNFIRVVGTKTTSSPESNFAVFGTETNDSYVNQSSAAGADLNLPGPPPMYYNDSHTELECDPDVIHDVGAKVKQSAPTCDYSINPSVASFDSNGGGGTVTVGAGIGCPWTAEVDNVDWIIVTSNDSGSGSGTVGFSVQPNTTALQRNGTIFIAGKMFNISQTGKIASTTPVGTYVKPDYAAGSTATMSGCKFQINFAGSFTMTITGGVGTLSSPYTGTMTLATTATSTVVQGTNCKDGIDPIDIAGTVSGSALTVEGSGTVGGQLTMTFSNGTFSGNTLTGILTLTGAGLDPAVTSTVTLVKN